MMGNPLKDAVGSPLHVLIKLLSTITLVAAPLFFERSLPAGQRDTTLLVLFLVRQPADQEQTVKALCPSRAS